MTQEREKESGMSEKDKKNTELKRVLIIAPILTILLLIGMYFVKQSMR